MSKHKRPAAGVAASSSRGDTPSPRSTPGRRLWRIAVPLVLAVTVIVVFASKPVRESVPPSQGPAPQPMVSHGATAVTGGIPRLVDLGADKCIPCKAMAPILVELRAEYAGRMQVDFIDVWKDPSAGDPYNIYAIPTQIFFGADGKELTRHEGFNSKADILATWKRFGYDFSSPSASAPKS
jgi:thioredoxin 1